MMISVVINKDKRLLLDLATYIAEHLPALPVLKQDRIVLDELAHIDVEEVCSSIRSFMSIRRVNYSMHVNNPKREVTIYIEGSSKVTETERGYEHDTQGLFICPHCNYTTEYADILSIHMRSHYI
ncbi:MAG: hypothetical protein QXS98_05345 [Candidatus Nitrosocaldus sp.]